MREERYAIIDIGSNAIRASVYNGNNLGSSEIYNDKFKSDILGLLELQDINIKHHTYLTFQHFIHIFKQLNVTYVKCIATAVLRDHPNADNFIKLIKEKFNVDIEVITGTEEARFGALGVIMAIPSTRGIIADFGGGSLELSSVLDKDITRLVSLPLGSKIIQQNKNTTIEEIKDIIKQEYSDTKAENLYFIGGALRLIGRLYMNYIKYPLNNLHNLEISKYSLLSYLDKIDSTLYKKQLYNTHSTLNNIENLPAATKISKALIEVFDPERIVISNFGLKEGVRFAGLDEIEKAKNVVFERCSELFSYSEINFDLKSYKKLIYTILPEEMNYLDNLIELSLVINNGIKNVDKSLRASYFSELLLSTDIPFSHRERVILALIMSFSYRSKSDLKIHKLSKKIISFDEYYFSQIVGNAIRIIRQVDGPEFTAPSFSFNMKGAFIELIGSNILPKPIFNKVCAHLKDIGFSRKKIIFKNYRHDEDD
jgi:exopolyphosphatase / guanosine-5'-triphosphate,3'-diphosphate pyrophosphatase